MLRKYAKREGKFAAFPRETEDIALQHLRLRYFWLNYGQIEGAA
jgi:hypothetical protein